MKRSIFLIVLGVVSAGVLIISAVLLMTNMREMENAHLRELAATQDGDRNEAIIFGARQDMLQRERNYFYGGIALGAAGLLTAYYLANRRRRS